MQICLQFVNMMNLYQKWGYNKQQIENVGAKNAPTFIYIFK